MLNIFGIRVGGSRTAAPRVEADELSKALVRVIDSKESAGMAAKTKMLRLSPNFRDESVLVRKLLRFWMLTIFVNIYFLQDSILVSDFRWSIGGHVCSCVSGVSARFLRMMKVTLCSLESTRFAPNQQGANVWTTPHSFTVQQIELENEVRLG